MQAKFSIMYGLQDREVRAYSEHFEDALDAARLLSTHADIRVTRLYRVSRKTANGSLAHVLLAEFTEGAMSKLLPEGKRLMEEVNVGRPLTEPIKG